MGPNLYEPKYDYKPLRISGLGGWLILVQIGLYGTILMLLMQLFGNSLSVFDAEIWNLFTSSESEFYHPLWGFIFVFEIVFIVTVLLFGVFILFNFYMKKSITPTLFIVFYCAIAMFGIIDYVLLYQIPLAKEIEGGNSLRDIIRSVLTSAIWCAYFIKSERVQNTFIK